MRMLSTPLREIAAIKCSTVKTSAPLALKVVALTVELTFSATALISGQPGKSVRIKVTPVLASAGFKVIKTSLPECRPMPE